jgi:hypothetical protein
LELLLSGTGLSLQPRSIQIQSQEKNRMTSPQNISNHTRYNPLHHFILSPLTVILIIWSIVLFFQSESSTGVGQILVLFAVVITLVTVISRLYALKNQDRIIRLEMRQKYFELTGHSFEKIENSLSLKQIIALRFASDEELLPLIDRAIDEELSPKSIKLAIKHWKADYIRV